MTKRPAIEVVEPIISEPPSLDPKLFSPYLGGLKRLISQTKPGANPDRAAAFASALDGQPSRELRRLYSIHDLRQTGTYFTGSELTSRLLEFVANEIPSFERIVDPSCGAGDLLVGAARHLPLKSSLIATLALWGRHLVGFDINASFVAMTRVIVVLGPNALVSLKAFGVALSGDITSRTKIGSHETLLHCTTHPYGDFNFSDSRKELDASALRLAWEQASSASS